jgi:hypothetical protein
MSSSAPHPVSGPETVSPEIRHLLDEVERKLQSGEVTAALTLLNKHGERSPWVSNAIGVCRLRDHQPGAAQAIFERLATDGGFVRQDVPAVFCLNLGIARLLQRNFTGFEAAMKVVDPRRCPAASKYLSCYKAWRKSHTLGERLRFAFLRESERPFVLDCPPGELR